MLCELPVAVDNFSRFKRLRAAYHRREQILSKAIVGATGCSSTPKAILDVGSADAGLADVLIRDLGRQSMPSLITLLEPDERALPELVRTVEAIDSPLSLCSTYIDKTLQQFAALASGSPKFDLIVASHVLYHFEDWGEALALLRSMLASDGTLVVILDSHSSPLYRARNRFMFSTEAGEHSGYGRLRFAEDMEALLEVANVPHAKQDLYGHLHFQNPDLLHHLYEVLSFIYRFPVTHTPSSQKVTAQLTSEYRTNNGLAFPWMEKVFTIRS